MMSRNGKLQRIFRIHSNYGRRHWCISHFRVMCSDWSWKGSLWMLAGESCGGGVMKLGGPWGSHWGAWGKVGDTGDGERLSRKTGLTWLGWMWGRSKNQGWYLSFPLELLGAIYQDGEEEQHFWGSSGALRFCFCMYLGCFLKIQAPKFCR